MSALTMRAFRGSRGLLSRPARPSAWVCGSCRAHNARSRRWGSSMSSSETAPGKPYYITTPIFYVNAAPHIGHLYTMVLTDVLKRWQKLNGREAFLCTGTDEHGMKIQQAANRTEMEPKAFCDENSDKFRDLAQAADISNDFFIRTTDADHKEAVEQFWLHLRHRVSESLGLYEGKHEGWYCVSDECFYPENMVSLSLHNQTGQKIMINTETENEVEWVSEKTCFFPLSKYKDALLKFYDENPDWIQPRHRMNEVREWVANQLEDLSITRPASRLSWGIRDPEDRDQTIYVWVDALINYLTKAGYAKTWTAVSAGEDQGLWPADLHVIGKDILRFHAIYWPALLMAVGLPLPKKILCHNHWTMSNRKMSKSIGNVVNPYFALDRWGTDPLRYFLMRNGTLGKDMDYSNELIQIAYEKELMANMGNLLMRVDQPKSIKNRAQRWSTSEAVMAYREGELQSIETSQEADDARFSVLVPHLKQARVNFAAKMDELDCAAAIRVVFELLRETNRFISDVEPWQIVKREDFESRCVLNWVIYQSSEALRIAGILLQPIIPTKAALLLDQLGVDPANRTISHAEMGKDLAYGLEKSNLPAKLLKEKFVPLFPKSPIVDEGGGSDRGSGGSDGVSGADDDMLKQMRDAFRHTSVNRTNRLSAWLALEAEKGEEEANRWLAEERAKEEEARKLKRTGV